MKIKEWKYQRQLAKKAVSISIKQRYTGICAFCGMVLVGGAAWRCIYTNWEYGYTGISHTRMKVYLCKGHAKDKDKAFNVLARCKSLEEIETGFFFSLPIWPEIAASFWIALIGGFFLVLLLAR